MEAQLEFPSPPQANLQIVELTAVCNFDVIGVTGP